MLEQHMYNMQDILLNTQKKKTHSYIKKKLSKTAQTTSQLLQVNKKWICGKQVQHLRSPQPRPLDKTKVQPAARIVNSLIRRVY